MTRTWAQITTPLGQDLDTHTLRMELTDTIDEGTDPATRANARRAARHLILAERAENATPPDLAAADRHLAAADRACPHPDETM